jgi:hypothetical protein
MLNDLTISVECADILDFACDVLILKYAQAFYGADALVADVFTRERLEISALNPGDHILLTAKKRLNAKKVLFVGVVPLYQFDYAEIRQFSIDSLRVLGPEFSDAQHVAMTMHGVGYGLDERESFLAQLGGLLDAAGSNLLPAQLKRVTIVERNESRAQRLKKILNKNLQADPATRRGRKVARAALGSNIESAGRNSAEKPLVFVAMPYNVDMEDVYRFGIEIPVNAAGYLCERVDMTAFMGDILARIKARIEAASLVVADLTGSNPNVYLEVGYAWGKGRPTLLLAKKGDELKFDVRGQRCIEYSNITDLERKLKADLAALTDSH